MVTVGKRVDNFTLPATGDTELSLDDFRGTHLVLYFYPKDHTPGCTREGQDFRDLYDRFKAAGADILGVSRDSVRTHENFCAKHDFPFRLLSDKEETLCKQFDVIREKKLYGRTYMGIDRSTFIIDAEGVLRAEWRKVKVPGHAEAVLEAVEALNA
ncbi:peroxiredoxin [Marinihelvus fidelis]|uniref:thioredoxin-dependent peroxiredoxin n=1 Tax=Marinihelvus fidelis TaxID=2613842 RepID=A0A5N0T5V5_9GAMM|nr:peroxiredoxin [Marinihelvus fidelis]KAA9129834.1 peroxiredoxin [Marinihelvus fidelis]